jgi:membrane protein implicated in regulation of membrane protease activity
LETDLGGLEPADDTAGADDAGPELEDGQGEEPDADVEGTGEEQGEGGHERGSVVGHDSEKRERRSAIFRFFSILRSVVYFSMGMGPVGWFSLARGESNGSSLIWGLPVGLVVMVGARYLRRLMRKELDSQLKDEDFLLEKGEVIVTIEAGRLGKVRVHIGSSAYADRFAKAKDPKENLPVGTKIRVVDLDEECLYVEREI